VDTGRVGVTADSTVRTAHGIPLYVSHGTLVMLVDMLHWN